MSPRGESESMEPMITPALPQGVALGETRSVLGPLSPHQRGTEEQPTPRAAGRDSAEGRRPGGPALSWAHAHTHACAHTHAHACNVNEGRSSPSAGSCSSLRPEGSQHHIQVTSVVIISSAIVYPRPPSPRPDLRFDPESKWLRAR